MDFNQRKNSEPTFVQNFENHGQIFHIHFSPFEWTKDFFLVGFSNRVVLCQITYEDKFKTKIISEFVHPQRCTALSLSANSSLSVLPHQVIFCSGASDFKLRVIESDLSEKNSCRVLSGHSSYINDVSFNPENTYLASGSDDNTVKLWLVNSYKLKSTYYLNSPVMAVTWHKSDPNKLMVSEKIGLIKFYNVETDVPILSLDFSKSLSSAHWSPSESQLVASLQLGELHLWDLSRPCLPQQTNTIFSENGGHVRFSPQGEMYAAVNRLEGSLKVVHIKTHGVKLSAQLSLPTNVQWHYHYPLVCAGDDVKLCFWKLSSF